MLEPDKFIDIAWIKPLIKRLVSINKERNTELREISNTFSDPIALAKYYIEPQMQSVNPADHDEDVDPISDVRTEAFKFLNTYLQGEIDPEGRNRHLIILSDAGMGKTSLLLMVKLLHLTSFWPKGFRCKLLKLGPETTIEIKSEQFNNPAKTVLLLDGLDEDPSSWENAHERLERLLKETDKFRRVVITCRTQFFPELNEDPFKSPKKREIAGYICPIVYVSPFDDTRVSKYLKKRFPDQLKHKILGRQNPLREIAIPLLRKMKSLRFRPLLLTHIEDIASSEHQTWNEFSIYYSLVKVWLLREIQKLDRQGKANVPKIDDLFNACVEMALQIQADGSRSFSESALDNYENDSLLWVKLFDFGGKSLLNRNSAGEYRFSHFSIQEFLCSYHLVSVYATHAEERNLLVNKSFSISDQLFRFVVEALGGIPLYFIQYFNKLPVTALDVLGGRFPSIIYRDQKLLGLTNIKSLKTIDASVKLIMENMNEIKLLSINREIVGVSKGFWFLKLDHSDLKNYSLSEILNKLNNGSKFKRTDNFETIQIIIKPKKSSNTCSFTQVLEDSGLDDKLNYQVANQIITFSVIKFGGKLQELFRSNNFKKYITAIKGFEVMWPDKLHDYRSGTELEKLID